MGRWSGSPTKITTAVGLDSLAVKIRLPRIVSLSKRARRTRRTRNSNDCAHWVYGGEDFMKRMLAMASGEGGEPPSPDLYSDAGASFWSGTVQR